MKRPHILTHEPVYTCVSAFVLGLYTVLAIILLCTRQVGDLILFQLIIVQVGLVVMGSTG